ncbi:outer membrane protein assembly factor BamE [Acidithiobacillus sp. CV18-2]|uniref:Outer membrane protein assembly factor BamE n=1 Tax=Igneacidithiobacillus copahuensis TaxID=2724909 RepID=A0AAE2YMI5_9PROT|nr:outer membrane protein assembly factor BamE [Igneacidithiobacillus copahuensis]MBU2755377.1 outer membrane protein assembly factor BamE [Acidithiobacillus sp. CV18-3]MBU2758583.1 outer membrane protein assembly factor BamE [Acidithiobacillus sp. BN09-2]MBU2777355.1 outer membrane protein assembly factor BamE [Acidithiobacillus sp. CV18-2]MBU2797763.1 outer membrane protein assembly factor BamE [Acidithiobacillus sp. VAN18-2]MBU2798524.1 outer membrane protein assembly factor BamE [Acidithio
MRTFSFLASTLLLCTTLSACSIYRVNVQQGNVVSQKELAQIHKGMDKAEVSAVLGAPLLQDPWSSDEWVYSYSDKPAYGSTTVRNVILHFSRDGSLQSISGDVKALAGEKG